jgi:hypothetical protein
MGETAKLMARDLLRATGSTCPVDAHRFADESGFTLRPTSGKTRAVGDALEYDATSPMDAQELAILDLMARWLLERAGDAVTDDSVAELLDIWLGAIDREDGGAASGSWTRA